MPRGKKELAEQIIPYAASVEVEVGRGKTVANGGQEDPRDGADVLVKRRSSTVVSGKDFGQAAEISRRRIADSRGMLADAELDSGVSGGRIWMTQGKRSQLLEPVHCGYAQLGRQELLLAMIA